jgi:dTDP-4-amino-4,6-dideoxygalactose transaminase
LFPKEEFRNKLPNAFDWGQRTISLSLSAAVSDSDCEKVVLACKSLLK